MKGQDVDEDSEPVSVQKFWSSNRYWNMFNTHFLRAGKLKSQDLHFKAFDLDFKERILALFYSLPFIKNKLDVLVNDSDYPLIDDSGDNVPF